MIGIMEKDGGGEEIRSWKDMTQVISNWAANKNPPGGARDGEILNMFVHDGRLATVVFRFTDNYYDSLILAKVNGEWKIVAKAFILQ